MKSYKKLVRDNIPAIIRASGEVPQTRILDDSEYLVELIKKLHEEVAEFEVDHSAEELADIQEVLIAIREAIGVRAGELEDVRRQKARKNGRFKKRIYLEDVTK
jgi:predicted house-cleaning noncanonical NTP pyrophosphatase (MazG superfamily)